MSINKMLIIGLGFLLMTGGCSNDTFITHNGNMPSNDRISQIEVGDSKNEVVSVLGAPSTVVSLDQNTWIYMSSDVKRIAFLEPEEISRDILTIKFDEDNKVADVIRLSKNDGHEVEISDDKTETVGHEPGFFERFFGGVGMYSPFGASKSDNF